VFALVAASLAVSVTAVVSGRRPLLTDDFSTGDGLVTNEFAYFNPTGPGAVFSPVWVVTSGSLFVRDHAGWTGVPDRGKTGPRSRSGTDSAVFRAVTRRADFQNVAVSFSLFVQRFVAGPARPPAWQGVHVFLRYASPDLLYVVSVDRRDGVVAIKKKVPGGPSAGGTYYTLAYGHAAAVAGRWEQVRASAVNTAGGGVELRLWLGGRPVLRAVDSGVGNVPAITEPGRVGLRGDYTQFAFDGFTVTRA
jgi:hypothetical protein